MGAIRNLFKSFMNDSDSEHYTPSPISNPSTACEFNRFGDLLPYLAWIPEERLFVLEGAEAGKTEGIGFCLEMYPQTGATPEMALSLIHISEPTRPY